MSRPLRETLDETRNILVAFRDALVGAHTVTPTPDGTARLLYMRDDRVPLLISRAAININELSEHIGSLDRVGDYSRSDLLDLLQDALAHVTPTLSTHEEIVALLHKERNFVCMCGYCEPTARSRNNGPCPACGATESHNCPVKP
jgi:hypothetical protein